MELVKPVTKRTRKTKEIKYDWKDEVVEKLVALWEDEQLLYDVKHPMYHIKEKRRNCITNIISALSEMEVEPLPSYDEVQRKLNALRSYYVAEKNKTEQSKVSGAGAGDIYRSKWQFYDALSFLSDNVTPRPTVSNIGTKRAAAEENCAYSIDNKPSSKSAKQMEVNKTNQLIETAINVLSKPKENPKKVEKTLSADHVFGDMIVKMLETINEGESKDFLKMEIQRLIFETKYRGGAQHMFAQMHQHQQRNAGMHSRMQSPHNGVGLRHEPYQTPSYGSNSPQTPFGSVSRCSSNNSDILEL